MDLKCKDIVVNKRNGRRLRLKVLTLQRHVHSSYFRMQSLPGKLHILLMKGTVGNSRNSVYDLNVISPTQTIIHNLHFLKRKMLAPKTLWLQPRVTAALAFLMNLARPGSPIQFAAMVAEIKGLVF